MREITVRDALIVTGGLSELGQRRADLVGQVALGRVSKCSLKCFARKNPRWRPAPWWGELVSCIKMKIYFPAVKIQ